MLAGRVSGGAVVSVVSGATVGASVVGGAVVSAEAVGAVEGRVSTGSG